MGLGGADDREMERGVRLFAEVAPILDGQLAKSPWVLGDALSLADLALAAPLTVAMPAELRLSSYPHLQSWLGRMQSLEAWKVAAHELGANGRREHASSTLENERVPPTRRHLLSHDKTTNVAARDKRIKVAAAVDKAIKVGLCGFSMAMGKYARHFCVVEVQQTFYDPPTDATMQGWVDALPPGFEFTMKAWQLITHQGKSPTYRRLRRPLDEKQRASCGAFQDSAVVHDAMTRTLACARVLGATAILFQCPASFRPDPLNVARIRKFFTKVANPERPSGVRYLWEPRGAAWTQQAPLARDLARELGLVHVVDPFVDPPPATQGDATTYFRLHGITGARHVYTDVELRRLADMTPPGAYVMFNNIPRVRDAERFDALLRRLTRKPA